MRMRNDLHVWVYWRSCLFWGLCFLFSHARIGLLIEPGRETEKIIIVPLGNADATRGHGHILLSSTGLRRHQPHLFLVWKSKSGWWEIPLRRFGGHPRDKFKLSNSNSNHGGCVMSSQHWQQQQRKLNGSSQRQEDVYPNVVMNVLPFKELGGRQRTASRRGSVKRYGFMSNVRDGCDERTDRRQGSSERTLEEVLAIDRRHLRHVKPTVTQ